MHHRRVTVFWNALLTTFLTCLKNGAYTTPARSAQQLDISCEQPFSCTSLVCLDLDLDLSAPMVSLQQSRSSSLLFFAGSFSLMRSCYETLLWEVGAPDSSAFGLISTVVPCFTWIIKSLKKKSHQISWVLGWTPYSSRPWGELLMEESHGQCKRAHSYPLGYLSIWTRAFLLSNPILI